MACLDRSLLFNAASTWIRCALTTSTRTFRTAIALHPTKISKRPTNGSRTSHSRSKRVTKSAILRWEVEPRFSIIEMDYCFEPVSKNITDWAYGFWETLGWIWSTDAQKLQLREASARSRGAISTISPMQRTKFKFINKLQCLFQNYF